MASSIFAWPGMFSSNGSGIVFTQPALLMDGTSTIPSLAFASTPTLGLYRVTSAKIAFSGGAVSFGFNGTGVTQIDGVNGFIQMGSTTSINWTSGTEVNAVDTVVVRDAANTIALKNGANLQTFRVYDATGATFSFLSGLQVSTPTVNATAAVQLNGVIAISATAPTVTSAGTSPSIQSGNGSFTFRVNVGTGGTATTIVLAMPTAPNGWNAYAENITATAANRAAGDMVMQSSTPNSLTLQYQTVATGGALAFTASDIVAVIAVPF